MPSSDDSDYDEITREIPKSSRILRKRARKGRVRIPAPEKSKNTPSSTPTSSKHSTSQKSAKKTPASTPTSSRLPDAAKKKGRPRKNDGKVGGVKENGDSEKEEEPPEAEVGGACDVVKVKVEKPSESDVEDSEKTSFEPFGFFRIPEVPEDADDEYYMEMEDSGVSGDDFEAPEALESVKISSEVPTTSSETLQAQKSIKMDPDAEPTSSEAHDVLKQSPDTDFDFVTIPVVPADADSEYYMDIEDSGPSGALRMDSEAVMTSSEAPEVLKESTESPEEVSESRSQATSSESNGVVARDFEDAPAPEDVPEAVKMNSTMTPSEDQDSAPEDAPEDAPEVETENSEPPRKKSAPLRRRRAANGDIKTLPPLTPSAGSSSDGDQEDERIPKTPKASKPKNSTPRAPRARSTSSKSRKSASKRKGASRAPKSAPRPSTASSSSSDSSGPSVTSSGAPESNSAPRKKAAPLKRVRTEHGFVTLPNHYEKESQKGQKRPSEANNVTESKRNKVGGVEDSEALEAQENPTSSESMGIAQKDSKSPEVAPEDSHPSESLSTSPEVGIDGAEALEAPNTADEDSESSQFNPEAILTSEEAPGSEKVAPEAPEAANSIDEDSESSEFDLEALEVPSNAPSTSSKPSKYNKTPPVPSGAKTTSSRRSKRKKTAPKAPRPAPKASSEFPIVTLEDSEDGDSGEEDSEVTAPPHPNSYTPEASDFLKSHSRISPNANTIMEYYFNCVAAGNLKFDKNTEGLVTKNRIMTGKPILEMTGIISLLSEVETPGHSGYLYDGIGKITKAPSKTLWIMPTNDAQKARRSCAPNAILAHVITRIGRIRIYIVTSRQVKADTEIMLPMNERFRIHQKCAIHWPDECHEKETNEKIGVDSRASDTGSGYILWSPAVFRASGASGASGGANSTSSTGNNEVIQVDDEDVKPMGVSVQGEEEEVTLKESERDSEAPEVDEKDSDDVESPEVRVPEDFDCENPELSVNLQKVNESPDGDVKDSGAATNSAQIEPLSTSPEVGIDASEDLKALNLTDEDSESHESTPEAIEAILTSTESQESEKHAPEAPEFEKLAPEANLTSNKAPETEKLAPEVPQAPDAKTNADVNDDDDFRFFSKFFQNPIRMSSRKSAMLTSSDDSGIHVSSFLETPDVTIVEFEGDATTTSPTDSGGREPPTTGSEDSGAPKLSKVLDSDTLIILETSESGSESSKAPELSKSSNLAPESSVGVDLAPESSKSSSLAPELSTASDLASGASAPSNFPQEPPKSPKWVLESSEDFDLPPELSKPSNWAPGASTPSDLAPQLSETSISAPELSTSSDLASEASPPSNSPQEPPKSPKWAPESTPEYPRLNDYTQSAFALVARLQEPAEPDETPIDAAIQERRVYRVVRCEDQMEVMKSGRWMDSGDIVTEMIGHMETASECENRTIGFRYSGFKNSAGDSEEDDIWITPTNFTRIIRRSCRPNCVLMHTLSELRGIRILVIATASIFKHSEVTLPFDGDDVVKPCRSQGCAIHEIRDIAEAIQTSGASGSKKLAPRSPLTPSKPSGASLTSSGSSETKNLTPGAPKSSSTSFKPNGASPTPSDSSESRNMAPGAPKSPSMSSEPYIASPMSSESFEPKNSTSDAPKSSSTSSKPCGPSPTSPVPSGESPTSSDSSEPKKLAPRALESFEVPVTPSDDLEISSSQFEEDSDEKVTSSSEFVNSMMALFNESFQDPKKIAPKKSKKSRLSTSSESQEDVISGSPDLVIIDHNYPEAFLTSPEAPEAPEFESSSNVYSTIVTGILDRLPVQPRGPMMLLDQRHNQKASGILKRSPKASGAPLVLSEALEAIVETPESSPASSEDVVKILKTTEQVYGGQVILEMRGCRVSLIGEEDSEDHTLNRPGAYEFSATWIPKKPLCRELRDHSYAKLTFQLMPTNDVKYVRRSCFPNACIRHAFDTTNTHLIMFLVATKPIPKDTEITVPFDALWKESSVPLPCALHEDAMLNCAMDQKRYERRHEWWPRAKRATSVTTSLQKDIAMERTCIEEFEEVTMEHDYIVKEELVGEARAITFGGQPLWIPHHKSVPSRQEPEASSAPSEPHQ